jgi:chitinase
MSKKTSLLLIVAVILVSMLAITLTALAADRGLWAPNVAYAVNDTVTYNGIVYYCIQAHTSQVTWEPPNVPALWGVVGTPTQSGGATATPTPTRTNTPIGPTNTPTNTLVGPTNTPTNTSVPPTNTPTRTNTPIGPTNTPTNTSVAPTNTSTNTSAPPTNTPTATNTSSGGSCWAPWSATTAYNGGAQVSYNGQNYQAAFWTQGDTPDTHSGPPGSGQPWITMGSCSGATPTKTNTPVPPTPTNTPCAPCPTATPTNTPPPGGPKKVVAYFAQWGIYARAYYVKNIETSGSAAKLNIIQYAFNNVVNNRCSVGVNQLGVGDAWADYQKGFDAATSVDGVGDTWNQPLKGNWNQLKKLKAMHPGLKVVMSLGGWTWSDGLYTAAQPANRAAFVASCIDAYIRGNIPFDAGSNSGGPGAAAGVFDGIDIDWEYPGICGNNPNCGASAADKANMVGLFQEFRTQLNAIDPNLLLTAAVAAGEDKLPHYDIPGISAQLNYINIMTYDFFGAWAATGPTAFHSALNAWAGMPSTPPLPHYYSDYAVQLWKNGGAPANKLLLGVGFYGRGWTGVPNINNGLNQSASGPAPCSGFVGCEAGVTDYKYLVTKGHPKFYAGGTQWTYNGTEFWSYDDPTTIVGKMSYVNSQGLGGAFAWSLDGDDSTGTLLTAIRNGLP